MWPQINHRWVCQVQHYMAFVVPHIRLQIQFAQTSWIVEILCGFNSIQFSSRVGQIARFFNRFFFLITAKQIIRLFSCRAPLSSPLSLLCQCKCPVKRPKTKALKRGKFVDSRQSQETNFSLDPGAAAFPPMHASSQLWAVACRPLQQQQCVAIR